MRHLAKIILVFSLFFLAGLSGYAQQSCYQIGLNEGRALFNEAQQFERNGRCVDAAPKYWEALTRFRLTRSCRDLPSNHELRTWEDRCINGITTCGAKYDETTVLISSTRLLRFGATGGEQTVTVNSNIEAWKVESNQSWCTPRKNGNRLIVNCRENSTANSRTARLVITANALTVEVTIEQAGKTPTETPVAESMKITAVRLAGGYADGTTGKLGDTLFNNLTSLSTQITCNYSVRSSKPVNLDFKIIDPNGKLLSVAGAAYTFSQTVTLRSGTQQDEVIDIAGWKTTSGEAAFATAGKYMYEIWTEGVKLFETTFEVAPRPVPLHESIQITGVQFAGRYADNSSTAYGDKLYNHINFVLPRVTCVNLTVGNKTIALDFSLLDPDGNQLMPTLVTSRHKEVKISGNIQQTYIFDAPEWGYATGTPFGKAGVYRFEIRCEGVSMYATTFEILPKPVVRPTASGSSMKVRAGVKAGLNLSTINNKMTNMNFSPSMSPNFHAGVFMELNFNSKGDKPGFLGVQPEVLYSRQGFAVDGNAVSFDYVTGLLMFKLHVHQNVNLEVGPWFSYLLSVNPQDATIGGQVIQLSDLKSGKDVGVAAGIGYDFDFGLMIGARYLYGLSDMANNLMWTNQVIAISLGWKF